MNWLTRHLSQLHYFGELPREPLEREPDLGVVAYAAVQETLQREGIGLSSSVDLNQYFLLVEDADAATERAQRAAPPDLDEQLPATFTLALDDGESNVLYLPEDLRDTQDVQLFSMDGERFGRVRATGQFAETSAVLENVTAVPGTQCSDGPCQRWGSECGDGCQCNKFEVTGVAAAGLSSLSSHYRSGPGHMYALRCR